jgi:hypothetical protein
MIDEHIILVELSSNSFNAICGFKHKKRNIDELKCSR